MAPLPHTLLARASRSHPHSSGSSGGGIGGGVVAVIISIMILVFICVYIHEYNKGMFSFPRRLLIPTLTTPSAKRVRAQTGAPIKHSKCFKKAFLIALTFGVVSLLCAECCGLDGDNNGDVGGGNIGGGAPQMDQMGGGGFVPQPMPSYQPQMNMGPG